MVACAGFGSVCGSSVATAATMARISVPAMLARGYSPRLALGTVAASGTLGIMIPPSVAMVIYGMITETDIAQMFIAGVLPGLLGTACYIGAVWWHCRMNPGDGAPALLPPLGVGLSTSCYRHWRNPGNADVDVARSWMQRALRAVDVELSRAVTHRFEILAQRLSVLLADAVDHEIMLR